MVREDGIVWSYQKSTNGAIIKKGSPIVGDVEIPATINGEVVTGIDSHAFSSCANMTSVVIPSNVTSIGKSAFKDCKGLTSVEIPPSVTNIGNKAFSWCPLDTVYVDLGERDRMFRMLKKSGVKEKLTDFIEVDLSSPNPVLFADEVNPLDPAYEAPELFENKAKSEFAGNATFNGWVRSGGVIAGTLAIKAARPTRNGTSRLSASFVPWDGKRQSIRMDRNAMPKVGGNPVVELPDLGWVKLGSDSLAGVDFDLQAGPDLSKSKDKVAKAAHVEKLAGKAGLWTFAFDTDAGYAGFSVKVDGRCRGKLNGTLPDGTKVALSVNGIRGDKAFAIPFLFAKKASFGFVPWLNDDGSLEVSDATAIETTVGGILNVKGWIPPSTGHRLARGDAVLRLGNQTQTFDVVNGEWKFPRHLKTKGAGDPNPYAVKLAFTWKTGVVKGSLSMPNAAGKLVKYTVNGVVVGKKFYGSASAKGQSSFKVTAE